jgi:hypothetical protein
MTPLADLPRWVAWRNEERDGKPTKVPYGRNGRHAKADDPATWISRKEAEARVPNLINGAGGGGVGIQLGDLGGDQFLAGVDLDSCIGEDGCLALWAEKILTGLDTYAERSPSGKGVKALFYIASEDVRPFLGQLGVTDPEQWGVSRSIPGERPKANHGPGVELYCARRYFAITDELWPGKPENIRLIESRDLERLAALIPIPQSAKARGTGRDTSRSAKAFREGARLRQEGKSFEEFCRALREHADPEIRAWTRDKGETSRMRELHRIWEKAAAGGAGEGVSLDDFWAYMPMHIYIFAPTGEMWPSASVNSRIPPVQSQDGKQLSATAWLDRNNPVEQMTWAPGLPMIIQDRLIAQGGWIERAGVRCFNLYRPAAIQPGDAARASPWIEHVRRIYPDEADHIIAWLAHRVQRPEEKINHALVLGGAPGIGKDTLLEPVKHAVGPWNFSEVSPQHMLGRFNGFTKSVVLRINEARDLGDFDRFKFYDHMKSYCAAPPDVLRVDEKNLREYSVLNCCGVVITTNYKTDGIYLPAADRRHHVSWSSLGKEDFQQAYWDELWSWYRNGGIRHVAAYLDRYDLSRFEAKAAPPKTLAFWEIVDASRAPEDAELADVIERLGEPDVVTISQLTGQASDSFADWLLDRKNSRRILHRLEACGYVAVRNDGANDGLWKIFGKRQAIYGKASMTQRDRFSAAIEAAGAR